MGSPSRRHRRAVTAVPVVGGRGRRLSLIRQRVSAGRPVRARVRSLLVTYSHTLGSSVRVFSRSYTVSPVRQDTVSVCGSSVPGKIHVRHDERRSSGQAAAGRRAGPEHDGHAGPLLQRAVVQWRRWRRWRQSSGRPSATGGPVAG